MNRKTAVAAALAALSVAALTACQPDGGATASGSAAPTASVGGASAAPSAPSASPSGASGAGTGGGSSTSGSSGGNSGSTSGSGATGGSGTGGGGSVDAAGATCRATDLDVIPAHLAESRPDGTGTGAVVVGFTNVSGHSCTVHGFPTVAGAGMGSPDHNHPLIASHVGSTATVKLHPGAKAWVKLTFVQVQGEADGYCVSGATPSTYPTMVVGLPGVGRYQTATDDGGILAECDDTVAVTAVSLVRPV